MTTIKRGLYRHWKGGFYAIYDITTDEATETQAFSYIALDTNERKKWSRLDKAWNEPVDPAHPENTTGQSVRFQYLGDNVKFDTNATVPATAPYMHNDFVKNNNLVLPLVIDGTVKVMVEGLQELPTIHIIEGLSANGPLILHNMKHRFVEWKQVKAVIHFFG